MKNYCYIRKFAPKFPICEKPFFRYSEKKMTKYSTRRISRSSICNPDQRLDAQQLVKNKIAIYIIKNKNKIAEVIMSNSIIAT